MLNILTTNALENLTDGRHTIIPSEPDIKKRDFAAHAGTPHTNHIINNTKTNNQ